MNEVCRLFGIEKLRITPYNLFTNQVERFHRTINSVLAKTVAENQRDWDVRLSYVMAAFRATRYDTTGYSPNFLVLGRETIAPPDLVYGLPDEESNESYNRFVEQMRERLVTAYTAVRQHMQRSAEKNKRYYDIGLRPTKFKVRQWILYFNPRKLRGKQIKWCRQYKGPYLVVETPSSVTAKILRTAKITAKTVHIDKLKAYLGTPLRSWLPATTGDSNTTVDLRASTSSLPPYVLIGPTLPPSTGQQTVPRPVNQQRDSTGKQRDLVSDQASSAFPPPKERDVESEYSIPNVDSIQWKTVRIPAEIVESGGSKPDNSGVQCNAVLVPASSESKTPGNNSARYSAVLTPVREETEKMGDSSVQWDADLTLVKGAITDVPVVDHATTPATVLQSEGESEQPDKSGKSWESKQGPFRCRMAAR